MGGNLFAPIAEILKPLKLDIIEPLQVKGKPVAGDFEKLDTMAEKIYQKHKNGIVSLLQYDTCPFIKILIP